MYKLLIVDDEAAICKGLREILNWEDYGIEIVGEAANGKAALFDLLKLKPDIVITDIRMPVMSGIDLIREVNERGLPIQFIILSAYNDFNYVKQGLKFHVEDYLLKPINKEELALTIQEMTNKFEQQLQSHRSLVDGFESIRFNILNRMMNNTIPVLEFKEKSRVIDMDITCQELQVVLIDLHKKMAWQDLQAIRQDIYDKLKQCDALEGAILFTDTQGRTLLINRRMKEEHFTNILKKVLDGFSEFNVCISMGTQVSYWDKVYQSYNQAVRAQDYRYIKKTMDVIRYRDIMDRVEMGAELIKIDYGAIECIIRNKETQQMIDYIQYIFTEYKEYADTYMGVIYNVSVEICILNLRILREEKCDIKDVISNADQIMESVLQQETLEELEKWLIEMCSRVINYLGRQREHEKNSYSSIIKEIVVYTELNYSKEISLKSIAELMYFNPVYIGTLFRKETGQVYTDYLNTIRIDKAKKLLSSTNYKARDIGDHVGFKNPNYFYTVFKKYTGMTPKNYRSNAHLKDKSK